MLLFKNGYFSLSFNVGKVVATIAKSKKKVLKFSVCFFKIKMQRFNYFHKNKTKTKNQKNKTKTEKTAKNIATNNIKVLTEQWYQRI